MSGSAHIGGVTAVSLTHDLQAKRSIVVLVWDNDPTKRVGLDVPFGVSFADLRVEAEKALRALSAETAVLAVKV